MDEKINPSQRASSAIQSAFCHFFCESHQYFMLALKTYHFAFSFSPNIFMRLERGAFDFARLAPFTRMSTLSVTFLPEMIPMSLTVIFPFDLGTGIRVDPESDTAMLYCVRSESMDRNSESGHASHAHLISMYSPSDADFLSVESVICFFIGWNSCSLYISAIVLPDKESHTLPGLYRVDKYELLLYRMFDWLHMNSDVGVGTKFFLKSFLNSCCYCMSIFQCCLSVHA